MLPTEHFNSISHLVGAVLALAGGALLVTLAARTGEARAIVSDSIYAATLFLLYLVSTLYHSLSGRHCSTSSVAGIPHVTASGTCSCSRAA
jgi:hemolysin III